MTRELLAAIKALLDERARGTFVPILLNEKLDNIDKAFFDYYMKVVEENKLK